jgi:hypothetical protein
MMALLFEETSEEVVFMHDFLIALEQTAMGRFIHESDSIWAFPFVLTVHTFGLCFIFGANTVVSMRLLGVASILPLKPLRRLFPYMWLGLILTILSGFAMAIAAATKRLFNPILLVKLVIIAVAVPIMWRMQKKVFDDPLISENVVPPGAKAIAASQIIMWLIVMTAGRLIAYSATIFGDGY